MTTAYPPTSVASSPARSSAMSATTTDAPAAAARRQTSAPIPLAPPVTRTTRPESADVMVVVYPTHGPARKGTPVDHPVASGR